MPSDRRVLGRGWSSVVLEDPGSEQPGTAPIVVKARRSVIHGFTSPADLAGLDDAWRREGEALRALRAVDGIVHLLGETNLGRSQEYRLRKANGYLLSETVQVRPRLLHSTCRIMAEVAAAVGRMHDVGWLHLDLNPSNIVHSRESGAVTLLDLGAAVQIGTCVDWSWPLGRHVFMAPEQLSVIQATPGPPLGTAADVHQLAFLTAFLLTGEHPYRTCGTEDYRRTYLHAVLHWSQKAGADKVAFVARICPDVPRWLVSLLAKCTDPCPERRPAVSSFEQAMRHGDLS